MTGCICSNLLMILFQSSKSFLWIGLFTKFNIPTFVLTFSCTGTFLYGLSMSSSFPTAIHLTEAYIPLTGKSISFFFHTRMPLLVSS